MNNSGANTKVDGDGVINKDGQFYDYSPQTAGYVGFDSLVYTQNGTIVDTVIITILPNVQYDTTFQACENDPAFDIDFAVDTPAIGSLTYSGPGVTGTTFDPAATSGPSGSPYTIYATKTVTVDGTDFTTVDSTDVTLTVAPAAYELMKDTSYCQGDPGVQLWLSGNDNGVDYVLEKDGTPVETKTGNGAGTLDFDGTYQEGNYTAYAVSGGCSRTMNGTATVTELTPTYPNMTYHSANIFCPGSGGVELGLDNSVSGVTYMLYHDGNLRSTKVGDGDSLTFGYYTDTTSYYTVDATNGTCTISLNDTLEIYKKPSPELFDLSTPSNLMCEGGAGVNFNLSDSESDVEYSLINSNTGAVYTTKTGTGSSMDFLVSDTGTYYVRGRHSTSNCTKDMNGEVTLSYYPDFSVGVASDTSVCEGSSVEIWANNASTYLWSPDSSLSDPTSSNPDAFPVNTTTYKVVGTDANGCKDSSYVTVDVHLNPVTKAGSDTSVCNGDSVQLVAGNVSGATYSWTPTSTLSDPGNRETYAFPSTTTEYTLTVTNPNGCSSTDKVTVAVDSVPAPSVNNPTICDGTSADLTVTGGDTYQWSTGATTPTITVSPGSSTQYFVTATYNNGCSARDTSTVSVLASPSVSATSDFIQCARQDTSLSASTIGGTPGYDYLWNTGETTSSINIKPSSSQTYQVTVSDVNGCTDSAQVNVTVNPLPSVSIDNLDAVYCKDEDPVTISGIPTDASGNFLPDSILTDNGDGTAEFDPNAQVPGTTYQIIYEYTDGNGCYNADTNSVEVSNDSVPNPTISNLDSVYCENDYNTYTIVGKPNDPTGTGTFSGVGVGLTQVSNGQAELIPDSAGLGNYSLTYTYTNKSGCQGSVSENFDVGIPFTIQVDSGYCASEDAFQLTVDKPAGVSDGTFIVYRGADTLYSAPEGDPLAVFDPSSQGPGDYGIKYIVNDKTTSCMNEDSVGFEVYPLPDARFTLDGIDNTQPDIGFCQNRDTVTLKGKLNQGGIYSGNGVIGNKLIPEDLSTGDHVVKYTYTDTLGCSATDSADVTIKPVPDVQINGLDSAYCSSTGEITLVGDPLNGSFHDPWGDADIFDDQADGSAIFDPSDVPAEGQYTISYQATAANGCSDSTQRKVQVNFIPTATFTGLPVSGTLCQNADSLILTGNPTDSNGSFSGPGIQNNGDGTAVLDPSGVSAGVYNVIYTYMDSTTICTSRDTQQIEILASPNRYTLSGGGFYCEGTSGNVLNLSGGESGLRYQLIKNQTTVVEDTIRAANGGFDFEGFYQEGDYSVYAIAPNGCADSMQNSQTITLKELPEDAQPITGDDTVAMGGTGSYTVPSIANANTYEWLLPSGSSIDAGGGTRSVDIEFSSTSAGYDSVAVYGRNGCGQGDTAYFRVLIQPLPDTAGPITGDASLCEGDQNITYSIPALTNADSIEWSLPAGFTRTSGGSTENITVRIDSIITNGYVIARGVNASGPGAPDSLYVNVFGIPDVSISTTDQLDCQVDSVLLVGSSSTAGASYSWTGGGKNVNNDTLYASQAGDYTLTVSANGCSNNQTATVKENTDPPSVSIAAPDTLTCSNPQTSLEVTTDAGSAQYVWTASSGGHIVSGDSTSQPLVASEGNYTVRVTDLDNGCSTTQSQWVEADSSTVNYTLSVSEDLTCTQDTALITATSLSDVTYTWTGPGIEDGQGTSQLTVNDTGTYQLKVTKNATGCSLTKYAAVEADSSKPTNVSLSKSSDIDCNHPQVSLTANTGTAGASYVFYPLTTGAIASKSGNVAQVQKPDDYAVTVIHPLTGCTAEDTITVKDNRNTVNVVIAASANTITCNTPEISLSINSDTTDVSVLWKAQNGGNITTGKTSTTAWVDAAGLYIAEVTDTLTGCVGRDTMNIAENIHTPNISDIALTPDSITCASDVSLEATVTGYTSLLWSGPGSISHPNQDSTGVDQPGTYQLTATAANGCTSIEYVDVPADTLRPNLVYTDVYPELTCSNTHDTLYANSGTPNVTYQWSRISGSGTLDNPSSKTPVVDGPGTYEIVVTGDNGCTESGQVTIDTNYTEPVVTGFDGEPDSISCDNDRVQLSGGTSSDAEVLWSTTGTGNIMYKTTDAPMVDAAGTYTLTLTHNQTGCQVDSTVTVYNNFKKPDAVVDQNVGQITCMNDTLQLDGSASTGVNFTWTSDNGHILGSNTIEQPLVGSDGWYILTVEHPHSGCTDKDSVEVASNTSVPQITMGSVSTDTLNCALDSAILEISSVDQPEYWWSTPDGNIRRGDSTLTAVVDAPGTYIFTARNPLTGCTNYKSVEIDQHTTQPNVSLSADRLTCSRDTVRISSRVEYATDVDKVSYAWTTGSGEIVAGDEDLPNPRVTQPGTYTLILTDDINACTRSQSIDVIRNTNPPDIYVDNDPNDITCARKTADLMAGTSASDSSYVWSTTGSGNIVNRYTATPTVDAAGWYTVKITDNKNGCYAEDSVYVDVDQSVPGVFVDPVQDITCSRSSVELSGSSSDQVYYSWSGGPGNISDPNSALTQVDAGGNYTLTVEDKVNGCSNDTMVTVYEDLQAPSAPLVSDTGSCYASANVALTASGSNITWYSDASLGASNQLATGSSYTPSMSQVGDSVFYVTQTGANGCESPAASVIYSVYGLPDAPAATDKTICFGETNPFLEAYPSDPANPVRWYNTSDSLLSTSDQYQPDPTTPGTYQYGVTQIDPNGCESPEDQAYFTINDLPAAPIVDQDTLRVCEGSPAKAFIAHGTNVRWYNTEPPASPISSGNIFEPGVSGTGTYTFYVTQSESSTSCQSPYIEVTYIIQPNPAPYPVIGGGTYCEGTGGVEIRLDDSDVSDSYELRRDGNTYLTNVSGSGGSLSFGLIKPEGTYTVYAKATNGCTSKMTGTAVVSVDSLPEAAGTITGDSIVCQGATGVDYTVPEIPYTDQYEWSVPEGAEIVAGENSRTITLNYSDTAQSGIITVYGTNSCGDGAVSTGHAITVNALPGAAGPISGPNTICQGADAVSFEVAAIEHASEYVWSVPAGATIVSGAGSRSIMVGFDESSSGGLVKVYGRNSCGTGSSSPAHSINVTPKPIIATDTYKAVCSTSDSLIAEDPGSATIQWSLIDGQATIASPNSFETEVTGLGTGPNAFEVTLTSNGCSDVDTVVIENNQRFVNAGADHTLCTDSYTLSGTQPASNVTGNWSVEQGSASFTDASQYNTTVNNLQKGVNVLRWTLSKDGCTSYDEVTLINDSPTDAEAGINQQLCSDSTWLDANTPKTGGGEWTVLQGYADFVSPTDPQTKIRNIARGSNLYRWTITNNACTSADTLRVSNNQVAVEAGPDQVICDYRTTMNAQAPVKGTGEWSIIKGSATFSDRHNPQSDVFLLVSDTTVLAWNVYYNGCQSADSMTIVNNSPTRADAGDNQEIFQSSTFLDATPPDKGDGEWSLLTGSAVMADQYDPKTEVTELAYGDNLFQWKVTYQNCVSIDSVLIDNQSSGSITAGNDTIICSDAMQLNASEPVQGEGEWSVVKGSGTFDNKNSNTTMVRNLSRGENILRWTVIGNGVISDEITITNNTPTQANAGPDMSYCVDSVQLSANNPSVGTGVWRLIAGEGTFSDSTKNNTHIDDLGNGKNTLRWTITNKNCTSTDDVVITNNQPTQADAGVDQTLCSDEATLYGNSPSVGEGLWTLVSGSNSVEFQDQSVGNTRVTNLGHGDNVLRWTITNGNCVSSDEVTITNDNPTQANAGRDKSICVDSFKLNANEAVVGHGSWSVINGYGDFEDSSNHETMVKNLDKGGNVLRWSIEHNGCISYDEVEISNDLIEADAGYDQSLCVDSTILSANNPGKGEGYWSVVSGSAVFEDASNPNTDVKGLDYRSDNILKWTITHKSCMSTDQITVENNSPGIVYAGEDNQVCDDQYYLKANPNYMGEGKWEAISGGATIVKDSSASTLVRDMGLGRNTFRWSVRRNGCVKHDDVTIYNNLPVQAYAGEDDTSCTTSYTLHAEEPPFGNGQWTVVAGSGNFQEDTVFNTTVTNLSQGANTFKWTVYNGRCSTSDEVTIVVNRPNIPRAGADQSICADSTTLQANLPGPGQAGHWEVVEGSGSFEDPSDPNTQVSRMSYGTNVFRWNISYKSCNLYDEVTITNQMPTQANAGQDIHVCGDQVRLNAVNPSIGSGEWSLVSGQAEFEDKTDANTIVRNLGFGSNTLRWKTTHGNCTSLDDINVYNDKATAYAGVDQEVYRDSTTLVANSVTRGEGEWIILGGSGTFANPDASQTLVRDLSPGVNTFRWTINNHGCISSDEVSITYFEMPDPEFDVDTAQGCPPLSVQFFNESLKVNSNFTWEFGDGNTSVNENPRHTFYQPGEYEVKLKTQGPDGTTVTEDTLIRVHDLPEARFDVAPDVLYIPEQHLQCYDMSIDADRYRWHFGDDSTSTEPSPMHHYQDTGTYNIRLEVWSRFNCYDDTVHHDVVTVEQSGKIRFPSGFTPNPHGPVGGHYNENSRDNNVFHPIVKGVEEYHMEIFNRWGVKVFSSNKVEIGWDGYYQGKPAEEGVYIYKVHGTYNNGTRFEKVGDFVLIRK